MQPEARFSLHGDPTNASRGSARPRLINAYLETGSAGQKDNTKVEGREESRGQRERNFRDDRQRQAQREEGRGQHEEDRGQHEEGGQHEEEGRGTAKKVEDNAKNLFPKTLKNIFTTHKCSSSGVRMS